MEISTGYQVVAATDKEKWNAYIHRSLHFDFYHTADYHLLEAREDAFLFIYERASDFIAIPLVKRSIPGSTFYDCTSVYGYTGPVSNQDFSQLNETLVNGFYHNFQDYLLEERIVSVFTRLHPIYHQITLLKSTADSLNLVGRTVAVDLRQSLDEQRMQYRRPIRMKINQLRNKGFEVRVAQTDDEIELFGKVYRENMLKVNASSYYLFSDEYFKAFLQSKDYDAVLLLAYYEGHIVAGAITTLTNNIVQLHLAGTSNQFLKESPMKLIYDEACILGRERGMHYMHLGSGVGGREDSLFHFKTGFSNCLFDFRTWNYIANQEVYDDLVNKRLTNGAMTETKLFPLYRFI